MHWDAATLESAFYILLSFFFRKGGLSLCPSAPPDEICTNRNSQNFGDPAGNEQRLIETSFPELSLVQRHGHDCICAYPFFLNDRTEPPSEFNTNLLNSGVLQRVHDRLERSLLFENEKRHKISDRSRSDEFAAGFDEERQLTRRTFDHRPAIGTDMLPPRLQQPSTGYAEWRIDKVEKRRESAADRYSYSMSYIRQN